MIDFVKSCKSINDFPNDLREVVFVGRSNAGKSSLLNALYNSKLAYTGKSPGKTRMINYFNVDNNYYAVDVPGYGFANRSNDEFIEYSNMMDDYFSRKTIALVIMIVDSRIGLTKDDLDMKEYLEHNKLKYIIVANKIDKLSNNELNNNKHTLFNDNNDIIYISCKNKKNIDILKSSINKLFLL